MTNATHNLGSSNVPHREGWYWLYDKGRPYQPQLYRIYRDQYDSNILLCSLRDKASTPENWTYLKQQGVDRLEYIGENLPTCIVPAKSGYYWVTSIVRVRIVEGEYPETKAEIIGSQYSYDWVSIIEMSQAVRIDFIAEVDGVTWNRLI